MWIMYFCFCFGLFGGFVNRSLEQEGLARGNGVFAVGVSSFSGA